jgi:CRISPR-associated endonuclease/helicase Cas3
MAAPAPIDPLADFWAKSPRGQEARGETLIAHTKTVIARIERLFDILPDLADRVADERLWHRAALAAILHDLGKVANGFQAQLRPNSKPWGHRHEVLSLAFLGWLCPEDPDCDLSWIAAAVVSHHRDKSIIDKKYPPPIAADDPYDPVAYLVAQVPERAIQGLAAFISDNFSEWLAHRLPLFPVSPAIPSDPVSDFRSHAKDRIYHALSNYNLLFRRLEREPSTSPSNLAAIALRGIVLLADHTASAHETPPIWPIAVPGQILRRAGIDSLSDAFPHQRAAASALGSAILIAPTGSGKTESALLWANAQRSVRLTGRLFYVLPYQASINAMHERLSNVFPHLVTLQHSRSLQAIYRRVMDNDQYDSQTAVAVAFRQRSLARLHYHPVRVLTPYQLLRSVFRLKGYEMILADAMNGLMIFDEIHAYEPKRLGMILAMLEYFSKQLGIRSLVISATLPSILRKRLSAVIGICETVSATPELFRQFARHEIHLLAGEIDNPEVVTKVLDFVQQGKSVLVVSNTVRRAKRLYDTFSDTGIVPELLHSRFNSDDRFRKESNLNARMGTRNRQSAGTAILMIATQVVEVSLDIDFDVLFTEPAPLESLIQRFGRVNRARRHRSSPVFVSTEPDFFPYIYDRAYISAAIRELSDCDGKIIDEATIGRRLDQVYQDEVALSWEMQVQEGFSELHAACIKSLRAFESDFALVDRFESFFDGAEVLPTSLSAKYDDLLDREPLAASSLLVPVPSHLLARLRRQNKLQRRQDETWIADLPYSPEFGLDLDG